MQSHASMESTSEYMKRFGPADIDERTCILQNYGLSQRDTNAELKETPVMFYDFAFDEDQDEENQTTVKNEDMWADLPLERLYRDGKLDHSDFPEMRPCEYPAPERALFVRVIDFPELRCCWADHEGFLEAVKAQMKPENHDPPVDRQEMGQTVMRTLSEIIPEAPSIIDPVRYPYIFKSGISFRALREPPGSESFKGEAFLALMVYMPYFDVSTLPKDRVESLSLSEYRHLERGGRGGSEIRSPSNTDPEILVHQVWFMVFNSEMIAMFRSAEDKHSDPIMVEKRPRPLLPGQERVGAFHALVQMISNIFTSSRRRSLTFFRGKIAKQEFNVRSRMENTDKDVVARSLDSLVVNIATLKNIVQSQVEILEDLRDIYENTVRAPAKRNCHNKNVVKIPVLHRSVEEISSALTTIDKIVEERKKYQEKLDVLSERAGKSKKYLDRIIKIEALQGVINSQTEKLFGVTNSQTKELLKGTSTQTKELLGGTDTQTKEFMKGTNIQTEALLGATKDQIKAIDKQNGIIKDQTTALSQTGEFQAEAAAVAIKKQTIEMERQRQVVTAFTILTTMFLPLGFCASYFGAMNKDGYLSTDEHHRIFWKWSGSITFLILFITLGVICQSHIVSRAMKKKGAKLQDPRRPSEIQPPVQSPASAAGLLVQSPVGTARPPPSSPPVSPTRLVPAARGRSSPQNFRGPPRPQHAPPTPQNTPPPHSPGQGDRQPDYYHGRQPQSTGQDNYSDA